MFSFKRRVGNKAEALALNYLKQKSLKLVEQNYLSKLGEIDIIMLDNANDTLVFVEVRYRNNTNFGSAASTVSRSKQTKLIRAAQLFLKKHIAYQDFICRFDVVGVESDLKYPQMSSIPNAFELEERM